MKQIRIKWYNKNNPEYTGHGEWFDIDKMLLLAGWCAYGNSNYPTLKYEIEFDHSK